jgi:hypothetical protein
MHRVRRKKNPAKKKKKKNRKETRRRTGCGAEIRQDKHVHGHCWRMRPIGVKEDVVPEGVEKRIPLHHHHADNKVEADGGEAEPVQKRLHSKKKQKKQKPKTRQVEHDSARERGAQSGRDKAVP